MGKIEQIKNAIYKAERRESKLSKEALEVPSMTSLNIRHLLNNLGAISTSYLEVGTHKGGHFCSVGYGNNLNLMVAIDNYSEFYKDGETKKEFFENAETFVPHETEWCLIEEDCFTVKGLLKDYFDFYNYDGQHTESSQQRAITWSKQFCANEFILVVDDWAFNGVETGTRNGIKLAGLEILFEQIFVTPEGAEYNEHWHNNFALFLLKK